ncbi:sclerostin domain-containing protein 1-like [Lycorma delicatula]|uniref:sclerostin domain-containing protein 1-like n=1 Tax=Lycorma delicatula TaxID=130591 RepID=UPI003F513CC8
MNTGFEILLIFTTLVSITKSSNSSSGNWSFSNENNNIGYTATIGILSQESCRLRSKRFVSNGLCTSPKPIGEVVCAESCTMPAGTRSPYLFHLNSLRKRRSTNKSGQKRRDTTKWKCIEASVRKKRVKLLCHDGTIRGYVLRLVTSCQCTLITGKKRKTENL